MWDRGLSEIADDSVASHCPEMNLFFLVLGMEKVGSGRSAELLA